MKLPNVSSGFRLNKYLFVVIIALLLLLKVFFLGSFVSEAAAFGGGGGGGGGRGGGGGMPGQEQEVSVDKVMQELTTKLQLNLGQVAEIQPIIKYYLNQSQNMQPQGRSGGQGMDQSSGGPQGSSSQNGNGRRGNDPMAALKEKVLDEASIFLNETQFTQFTEILDSYSQKGQQRGGSGGRSSGGGGQQAF